MNKTIGICLTVLCWLLSACTSAGATGDVGNGNSFANKDGTSLTVAFSSRLHAYEVKLAANGKSQLIETLPVEFENRDLHSASISDLNGDGFGDVSIEGDCGNRACNHLLYFFEPSSRKLNKVLIKEFSTATLRDNLLILGAGSGCCSFEYQALRLSTDRMAIDPKPVFYAEIESTDASTGKSECYFLDSNLSPMSAPQNFLNLCTVYGPSFKIKDSEMQK